ncbi:cystatin-like, partial [Clarias magur]
MKLDGAPEDADINDPDIKEALRFAVDEYNARSNSIYISDVVNVISTQSQVIAGIQYIINVKMGTTSCKKANAKKKCTIHSDPAIANVVSGAKYIITVNMATTSCKKADAQKKCTVHSDPAIAKVVALLLAVFLAVGSAGLVGGAREVDKDREDVQDALKFAVTQHNKASNDAFLSQVSRVIKAQTQVVSGTNYIFNVEMVRTNCKKGGLENECAAHSDPNLAK